MLPIVFFLSALECALGAILTPESFLVNSLPDLNAQLNFKQYAGFMPLEDKFGTELFFWFVESQGDPSKDPVALWMNGGPGSSSVAYGFWTEHGPFRLKSNGNGSFMPVLYNQSWNKISSIIYVEAPSGVGLSFSQDTTHYQNVTDAQSAHDNFLFLQAFFKVFTDFKINDFYITAESYGGHYGPSLAEQLLDNPNDINMKGFLIGNPGIESDWYYNVNEYAFVTFTWSHGLIPGDAYFAAVKACDWNSFFSNCTEDFTHPSLACKAATTKAVSYIPSPLDPYNILTPTCHEGSSRTNVKESDKWAVRHNPFLDKLRIRHGRTETLQYNPCIDNWTPIYMNRDDVLLALHVDPNRQQHWRWPGDAPGWYYNDGVEGTKKDISKLFPKFFDKAPQWKILVVSGDADAAVPFMGTERWIHCLNRPVTKDFRKWTLDQDVAGMVVDYDRLSFATVKGCGHTIPTYCPEAGFAFFANWLTGNWS